MIQLWNTNEKKCKDVLCNSIATFYNPRFIKIIINELRMYQGTKELDCDKCLTEGSFGFCNPWSKNTHSNSHSFWKPSLIKPLYDIYYVTEIFFFFEKFQLLFISCCSTNLMLFWKTGPIQREIVKSGRKGDGPLPRNGSVRLLIIVIIIAVSSSFASMEVDILVTPILYP